MNRRDCACSSQQPQSLSDTTGQPSHACKQCSTRDEWPGNGLFCYQGEVRKMQWLIVWLVAATFANECF